jgi:hypothetical protein
VPFRKKEKAKEWKRCPLLIWYIIRVAKSKGCVFAFLGNIYSLDVYMQYYLCSCQQLQCAQLYLEVMILKFICRTKLFNILGWKLHGPSMQKITRTVNRKICLAGMIIVHNTVRSVPPQILRKCATEDNITIHTHFRNFNSVAATSHHDFFTVPTFAGNVEIHYWFHNKRCSSETGWISFYRFLWYYRNIAGTSLLKDCL